MTIATNITGRLHVSTSNRGVIRAARKAITKKHRTGRDRFGDNPRLRLNMIPQGYTLRSTGNGHEPALQSVTIEG